MTLFSAIRLAAKAHERQWRLDGDPYIEHPLAVLHILWELSLDLPIDTYIAAVLHDILEDTEISYEDLNETAGNAIAAVVRVLTKDDVYYGMCPTTREQTYLERIRSLSLCFPYAMLIKMADRLHNVRTAVFLSPEKREKLLDETDKIYMPLIRAHIDTLGYPLKAVYERCFTLLEDAL